MYSVLFKFQTCHEDTLMWLCLISAEGWLAYYHFPDFVKHQRGLIQSGKRRQTHLKMRWKKCVEHGGKQSSSSGANMLQICQVATASAVHRCTLGFRSGLDRPLQNLNLLPLKPVLLLVWMGLLSAYVKWRVWIIQ